MIREFFIMKSKREKFSNLMATMKLKGFYLVEDKKIMNGHLLKIRIPATGSYSDFEKKKEQLEDYFGARISLEKIRFTNMIQAKVITKDIGKYNFMPVATSANKLWIAKEFDGTDFFLDLDKEGHLLIGGQSGGGKSYGLAAILTNLIYNNSKYIEIYLNQTMKGEIEVFSKCKPVKSVSYTLEEVAFNLDKVAKKVNERAKYFSSLGAKNLTHYIQTTKKGMKRIFFIVEEASFLNVSDYDTDKVKELKGKCLESFLTIVKAGRSTGVHLIMLVQRSTLANLSSELKAQMCCATTWQRSDIDSKNIIEVSDAKDLEERELYIWSRRGLKMLKMPFLDDNFEGLRKYVSDIITPTANDIKKNNMVKNESKVEKVSYIDMPLEEYNKIISKKSNVIELPVIEKKSTEKHIKIRKGAIVE